MSVEYVQLGEVATLQAGIGFPLTLQGKKTGLYPFAKVGDISRCGRTGNSILGTADHFVDQSDVEALGAKPVPIGSVLFAKIGEAIRQNHRVIAGCKMLIDNNAMAAIPGERIDGRFLYHFLKTVDFYCLAPATTVPALRKSDLGRLQVPLPPLLAQRHIAAILDQADALRAKRREALAQLDNLTQSIFIEMFGDPIENPLKWATCTLGEIAREKPNNGIFRKNNEYVVGDDKGLPVVWLDELFKGTSIDTSESRRIDPTTREIENYGLKAGDLLFCRSSLKLDGIAFNNVYIGADNAALFECHLIRISPNLTKVNPIFITHLLRLPQLRAMIKSRAKTSTMTTIDQQGLCAVSIVLPPLPEQDIFASRIKILEVLKGTQRAALKEFDNLFASLQHRAFRGEL